MTPARIPLPSRDDIPRPVASPEVPPAADIEVTEFEDMPTNLERRCPGCSKKFLELEGDFGIPVTHAAAWGPPYDGACRGSRDPGGWYWCKSPVEPAARPGDGRLVLPQKMEVFFLPDRRKTETPVVVDQRAKKG